MAPKSKSVLKMIADLELTGVEGVQRKLRRAAGEFADAISFDDKQFLEGWTKARSEIGKTWAKTIREAAEASFSPGQLRKVVHQYEDSMKKVDASHLRVEKLAAQIRERQAKGLNTQALQQEALLERRRFAALHKGFDEEMRHVREVAERRKDAVAEAERLSKRTYSEAAEELGNSLSEQFDRLKSGDVASVLKAAGRRLNTASVQASQKAGEGGKSGKAFEGLSQVLGKLGPAVIAIGAVVAGIAALVKIMIDADAKAKELNRTLLEGGVQAGDLATTYERTGEALDRARRSFTAGEGAFAFNRIWGTTAEEHLKVLGAYAEAGLTMRKLARGVKDAGEEMERYRDATAHALTYSKLLGISTNEVATATAGYMEDLGLSLKGVQERFSEVELAARESGFGTKRFFSLILQATSGLTGYNVRLTQAASLLKSIGKVLGPKAGGELLSSLQRGFGHESIQDRYRRLLVTGNTTTSRVFKAEAEAAVSELAKRVAEAAAPQQAAVQRALGAFGIDLKGGKAVAQLGKLSANQQADLVFKAGVEGVSDELVRVIRTAVETARGSTGDLATRANALGNIGAGGTLALKLLEAQRLVGPLHLLKGPNAMAAQNITGISGEEFTQLVKLSETFSKLDEKLKGVQRDVKSGKAYDATFAEQLARRHGVYVDPTGRRRRTLVEEGAKFSPGQGTAIEDSFVDLIATAGEEFKGVAEDQVPRDIQLAQEMVHNTSDITKILEQGVEYWLEQIYSVVQGIYSFFGSEKERKNRTSAIESLTGDIDRSREDLRAKEKELSDLVARMKGSQGADRSSLAAQVEGKRHAVQALQGRVAALSKIRSKVTATPARYSWLSAKTPEEFKKEAIEQSKQDILDAAKKAGITGPVDTVLGQLGLGRGGNVLPPTPPATSVSPALPPSSLFFPPQPGAHPRSKTIVQNNHIYYNNAAAISKAIERRNQAVEGQAP